MSQFISSPAPVTGPVTESVSASILILMASYQGADWLGAQLASIAAQEDRDWALWVSDDGSTDSSRAIVQEFAARHAGRNSVHLVEGPRAGTAGANFLSLLQHPDLPIGPQTYVAFADQDDIWYPQKLSRALSQLQKAEIEAPGQACLYGAQSRHVDERGRPNGKVSRRPSRAVDLGNALVQNMVSGHSAVLSPAAVQLARAVAPPQDKTHHDWWLSQLILACGGQLIIDTETVLDYRQHRGNAMGEPGSFVARQQRLRMLCKGQFRDWILGHLAALKQAPLTPDARAIITALQAAPAAGPGRLAAFRRLGLRRQSGLETLVIRLAALIGRC